MSSTGIGPTSFSPCIDGKSLPLVTQTILKFDSPEANRDFTQAKTQEIAIQAIPLTSENFTSEGLSSSPIESSENSVCESPRLELASSSKPNLSRADKNRHRAYTVNPLNRLPTSRASSSNESTIQEPNLQALKTDSSNQLDSLFSSPREQKIFLEIAQTEVKFAKDVTRLKNVIGVLGTLLMNQKTESDKANIKHVLDKFDKLQPACLDHFNQLQVVLTQIQSFANTFSTKLIQAAGAQDFTSLPVNNIATYIKTVDFSFFEYSGKLVSDYNELCKQSGTSKKAKEPEFYLDQAFRLAFEALYPTEPSQGIGANLYAAIFQRGPRYELLFKDLHRSSLAASSGTPTEESIILEEAIKKIKKFNEEMSEATPLQSPVTPRKHTDSKKGL